MKQTAATKQQNNGMSESGVDITISQKQSIYDGIKSDRKKKVLQFTFGS